MSPLLGVVYLLAVFSGVCIGFALGYGYGLHTARKEAGRLLEIQAQADEEWVHGIHIPPPGPPSRLS